jgi:hypothetical protein
VRCGRRRKGQWFSDGRRKRRRKRSRDNEKKITSETKERSLPGLHRGV